MKNRIVPREAASGHKKLRTIKLVSFDLNLPSNGVRRNDQKKSHQVIQN